MIKALIIDDELQLREFLKRVLGSCGFEVATVPTGEQALDRLSREVFGLVIVDQRLAGGESGTDVIRQIRRTDGRIPVILFSGVVDPALDKLAREAGATDVVQKGMALADFTARIQKLLRSASPLPPQAAVRAGKCVLIVDDEAPIRDILSRYLKSKGYATLEASSGEEAIRAVQENDVSVVLLDVQMPGLDGLQTLERLKRIKPDLGVVMATGVHDDARVSKAIALGASGHLLKPFDFLYLELVVLSKIEDAGGR